MVTSNYNLSTHCKINTKTSTCKQDIEYWKSKKIKPDKSFKTGQAKGILKVVGYFVGLESE
jgi:hypothetical protein